MEEEGICYYFEHTDTVHKLILGDGPGSHTACALAPEVSWEPSGGSGVAQQEDYIRDWTRTVDVRAKKWTQGDFQFEKPKFHLVDSEPSLSDTPGPNLERYDYPGRFGSMDEGQHLTRIRIEEEEAGVDTVLGQSNCRGFVPGYTFELKRKIYQSDQTGAFLLSSLDYDAEQGSLYGGDESTGGQYQNRFTAIPAKTPFRPTRVTPRPFVHGPQTAFVTGPSGEEMYVDKYGRVKVQFHWDREGQYNETSSCWVRVSQSIAGLGWGAMQLPRGRGTK